MERFLFRFVRSLKLNVQIIDYNLTEYYDVYSIPNSKDKVLVKWNFGYNDYTLEYDIEEIESNIEKGVWVKIK